MIGASKTRSNRMIWYSLVAALSALVGAGVFFVLLAQRKSANPKVAYSRRPFSFTSKNLSNKIVWLYSIDVLGHTVGSGRLGTRSVGDRRKDWTPEALLTTQAKFLWWEMEDPKDFNAARRGPQDPALRRRCSLPFPEFDVEADAWHCFYSLQQDNTWAGIFKGTVSKPLGAKPDSVNPNSPGMNQQWIHFNFRNLSGKRIRLDGLKTQLISAQSTATIKFPDVPADKQFHCTTAHSHRGSIYRPTPECKLQLVFWHLEGNGPHEQSITLPEFSVEQKNWYCYLTLGDDQTWSAVFEGTEQEAARRRRERGHP